MADAVPLRAARAPRTGVRLARALLDHIRATGMETGDRLPPEAEMAHALGVGKGSLREALLILEVHGFVTITPGAKGGARVSAPGAAAFGDMATMFFQHAHVALRDVLQARVALEPFVARLASTLRDAGRMSELQAVLDESRSVDVADPRAYTACANQFHRTVARLSGNPVLDLYVESLVDTWVARVPMSINTRPRQRGAIDDHVRIGEAILAGDADGTERLMREHMESFAGYARRRHAGLLEELLEWR